MGTPLTEPSKGKAAMSDNFGYVIVGAGSAGCVVASKLSANPAFRVLLIEGAPRMAIH